MHVTQSYKNIKSIIKADKIKEYKSGHCYVFDSESYFMLQEIVTSSEPTCTFSIGVILHY